MLINGKEYNLPNKGQFELAKRAYARYGAVTDFLNFRGEPMPDWDALPALIQLAWVASANPAYVAKGSAFKGQADELIARVVAVLDAPGYDWGALNNARQALYSAGYALPFDVVSRVDEYFNSHNGTKV